MANICKRMFDNHLSACYKENISNGAHTMTFEQATQMRDIFEAQMKQASAALRAVPGVGTGTMGLTPDNVKASAAYQDAKRRFEWDFANLRKFNAWYVKTFKIELKKARA